jgi:hypothetical protein
MSTSSASTKVTAAPALASARSPSMVTMRLTVEVRPDFATAMASPGLTLPLAMVPEKPRKSRLGRFTHCTGMRNARSDSAVSTSTVSRCSSSAGPVYQGVFSLLAMTLSPNRADSGIAATVKKPSFSENAANSLTMSSNTVRSKPTKSILLTASTMCRMPSSEAI